MSKRGKRKSRVPRLDLATLKHSGEGQALGFAWAIPGILLLLVAIIVFFTAPKDVLGKSLGVILGWPIIAWILVKIVAGQHQGRINSRYRQSKMAGTSFPELREVLSELARRLEIRTLPDTYVIDSSSPSATIRGMGKPYMMISRSMIDMFSPADLRAILAVLLGHVKAGTVKWRTFIVTALEMNPILKLLALPMVIVALLGRSYLEDSQLSADRMALFALQGEVGTLLASLVRTYGTAAGIDSITIESVVEFLGRRGLQATETDVNNAFVLSQMQRNVPGLAERWKNITDTPHDPKFVAQMDIARAREFTA
ncbi:MAG TPA: hypothetical protein DCZ72_14570 [Armatimonadetes bacterium]|nr:hypothetical protein [Armatimonadota bacterium]